MLTLRAVSQRGVTLIELVVVLVILSIALSVVIPSIGNSYDSWALRSAARHTVAFFRQASDSARREGIDLALYYDDHRLLLFRNGSRYKELGISESISVQPQKPNGAVLLSTGQIVSTEQFVLENTHGRKAFVVFGPLPGQVELKEKTE